VGALPVRALHHIDLAVSDVERSVAFYMAVLGPVGMCHYETFKTYRGSEDVVYLQFGEQYIGFRPADGGEHRYYEVGIEHFAFYVDNREEVDAAYRRCLDVGARIDFPPEEDRDLPGYYEMFVFDPDGMRVEVACAPAGETH
jgi:glyoxylase I family protein